MTIAPPLYACLSILELPFQAILRSRPELGKKPVAVLTGQQPSELVCSVNAQAANMGVAKGMSRVEVETFPSVIVLSRSQGDETAARKALFECAGRFSPRIEDCSQDECFTCVLDIAGSRKLFGKPERLGEQLLEAVKSLGIFAAVVIAGNLPAAVCLANCVASVSKVLVVPSGKEASALGRLRISEIGLSPRHVETFSSWGITTLGELSNLSEEDLIVRLGQEGKWLRQLARGEACHLFMPVEPALALEEQMDLDSPVEIAASLLFVIAAMLDRLIAHAKSNLFVLASVTIHAALEGGGCHVRTVRSALPGDDCRLWIKLIDLDLQAHPPQAAVVSLRLQAQPGDAGKFQLGLFCPQTPEPMKLDVVLARIRAIVGQDSVGRPVLRDTHHPQGFRMEPFVLPALSAGEANSISPHVALRQIRPPEEIPVGLCEHSPETFVFRKKRYTVERAYGPWFSSGDWWNAEPWSLEQWDLVARAQLDSNGLGEPGRRSETLLCCCLTHDRVRNVWRMEALYD